MNHRIRILEQEFYVSSDSGDEYVSKVVDYVTVKVEEIRSKTGTTNTLKIAVLAALNIADDYFKLKGAEEDIHSEVENKSEELIKLIDEAI
ncbi:MAG: cell division protein ZapA [Deltaproteobacteria bacterium]|nr:cell division protein ZapA [Deltaproteobacteria bacterium]